jgi:LysM repeat protein
MTHPHQRRRLYAGVVVGSAFMLSLAGCFRPAGDEAPSAAEAAMPILTTPTDLSAATTAATTDPNAPIAITMVSGDAFAADVLGPTADPQADAAGGAADPAQAGPPITVIAIESGATLPATPAPTRTPGGAAPFTPEGTLVTLQFITPFSPLAPITPDTPAPAGAATATPSGLITPTSLPGTDGTDCLYTVQSGDSLYAIALSNGITLAALRAANPDLTGDAPILQIGQQIALPCGTPTPEPPVPTALPTLSAILGGGTTAGAASTAETTAAGETYTVRPGDTLTTIAGRYGVTVAAIIAANTLEDPDRLEVGQVLVIPGD